MNEKEKIEHEIIKNALKMGVLNNPRVSDAQKQQVFENIDRAAMQADWIVEILRKCGYLG
jgi:hypothetical protein